MPPFLPTTQKTARSPDSIISVRYVSPRLHSTITERSAIESNWVFGSEGGGGSAARYRGSAILTVLDADQDQESPCGDGPYAHVRAAGGLARRDGARRRRPSR